MLRSLHSTAGFAKSGCGVSPQFDIAAGRSNHKAVFVSPQNKLPKNLARQLLYPIRRDTTGGPTEIPPG
jgi:hypothetical protein